MAKAMLTLSIKGLFCSARSLPSIPWHAGVFRDCKAHRPATVLFCRWAFSANFPIGAVLRKELGEQLLAVGLVGAAMSLFEPLELWDALILCYRMLQKVPQAKALVLTRLQVTPNDARLWCSLGDLTLEDAHLHTAWERSGHRSSAKHWEAALAINPLHPEGWFALGYCCIKTQDYTRACQSCIYASHQHSSQTSLSYEPALAEDSWGRPGFQEGETSVSLLQAFTRCAQQEPDNGEAWNNLAAIHLQLQRPAEAFNALSEAVKVKRDSWQTWGNYAQAAAQTGHWLQAARGVLQAFESSKGQHLELEVLTLLEQHLQRWRQELGIDGKQDAGSDHGLQQFQTALGSIFKAASVAAVTDSRVWGLHADYFRTTGFHTSAKESLLKQVRALQGSGWQADQQKFDVLATATIALCELQLSAFQKGEGSLRELSSTRLHLRTVVKQAEEHFDKTDLHRTLRTLMVEVEQQTQQARTCPS
eukprot:jgi/Astpho2/6782/Aster-07226